MAPFDLLPLIADGGGYAQSYGYGATGYGDGPATMLFKQLVPVLATLVVIAIPAMLAIPATIVHVTFWRRDNRAAGKQPFDHEAITSKVYTWGRIYGVGSCLLLQGLVEMLLDTTFSWYLRGSLVVIAFVATGPVSRLMFDVIRGHAAAKVESGKNGWWKRVYQYLTVRHAKPGEPGDDTFYIPQGAQEDPTEPKS